MEDLYMDGTSSAWPVEHKLILCLWETSLQHVLTIWNLFRLWLRSFTSDHIYVQAHERPPSILHGIDSFYLLTLQTASQFEPSVLLTALKFESNISFQNKSLWYPSLWTARTCIGPKCVLCTQIRAPATLEIVGFIFQHWKEHQRQTFQSANLRSHRGLTWSPEGFSRDGDL